MDLLDINMAVLSGIMLLLGIASLVGFITTDMWHCLMLAVMCFTLVGVWYYEDYYSKGKSLWQKKNTER